MKRQHGSSSATSSADASEQCSCGNPRRSRKKPQRNPLMDNARLERARCVLAVVCASTTLVVACKRQAEWGKYERREYVPSISQLRDTSDDEFYALCLQE